MATQKFAEIGAAYEMLTEEKNRAEARQREAEEMHRRRARDQRSASNHHYHRPNQFDPFFQASDPFQLFEEMFRNMNTGMDFHNHHSRSNFNNRSSNNGHPVDPFFQDPFFQSSSNFFGNSAGLSAFGMMDQMMSSIHNQQHPRQQHSHRSMFNSMLSNDPFTEMERMTGGSGNGFSSFSSSSTSYFGSGAPGERVTKTTRIVNGKRQTQIERTVVHPDGREETTVEVDGDDDFPQHTAISNGQHYERGRITSGDKTDSSRPGRRPQSRH